MVSRNSSPRSKKSVSLSVMLGTLLVPLSAYAASSLVETSGCGGVGDRTGDTGGGVSRQHGPVHWGRPGDSLRRDRAGDGRCRDGRNHQPAATGCPGRLARDLRRAGDAAAGTSGAPTRGHPAHASAPAPTGGQVVVARRTTSTTVVMGETTRTRTITAVTAVTMTTMTITAVMGRTTIEPALDSGTGLAFICRDLRPSRHDDSLPNRAILSNTPVVSEAAAYPRAWICRCKEPSRCEGSGSGPHGRRAGDDPGPGDPDPHRTRRGAHSPLWRRPMSRFDQGRWNRILVWTGAGLAWGSALIAGPLLPASSESTSVSGAGANETIGAKQSHARSARSGFDRHSSRPRA